MQEENIYNEKINHRNRELKYILVLTDKNIKRIIMTAFNILKN